MSKIKIILLLVLPLFLLYSSCSEHEVYDDHFYSLLNDILSQYDSSAVVIIPQSYNLYKSNRPNKPPPPPTFNSSVLLVSQLEAFVQEKYLSEEDVIIMLNQIDGNELDRFDYSKIELRVIKKKEVENLYKIGRDLKVEEYISETYKTIYIIFVTKPLFNLKKTKMYFQIDYYCGNTCGGGMMYLCERNNDGWKIIRQILTWIG